MLHFKTTSVLLSIVILLFACKPKIADTTAQPGIKSYQFKEVGWQISIPPGFDILDSAGIATANSKGQQAIQKTYDTTVDFSATKTLLSLRRGQLNTLTGTITPFDSTKDGSWKETNEGLHEVVLETLASQAPGIKIDTASGMETIGGLEFDKFKMVMNLSKTMTLTTYLYSRLQNGYDLGITVTYVDEPVGKELMSILSASKFNP